MLYINLFYDCLKKLIHNSICIHNAYMDMFNKNITNDSLWKYFIYINSIIIYKKINFKIDNRGKLWKIINSKFLIRAHFLYHCPFVVFPLFFRPFVASRFLHLDLCHTYSYFIHFFMHGLRFHCYLPPQHLFSLQSLTENTK